jgi:ketosteroid isomerase-like protein
MPETAMDIDSVAQRYAAAAHAKDEAAFLALYDEDVVVFDLWERWVYKGRDAWAGMVKAWFGSLGSERVAITFAPEFSTVDGDWALWCAIVRYAGISEQGVELRALENRISWTLRRHGDQWRILHEHTSAPADFESLKVSLHRGG